MAGGGFPARIVPPPTLYGRLEGGTTAMLTAMNRRIRKMKLRAQYRVPTVKVAADTKLGYRIINEADYDPDEHELVEEQEADESGGDESTVDVDSMSVVELDALIADRDLGVDRTLRKAEKVAAVKAALG